MSSHSLSSASASLVLAVIVASVLWILLCGSIVKLSNLRRD